MFEGKKIFIFGMARSGYEAAKLLKKHNNEIVLVDGKKQDEEKVKELEELGVIIHIDEDSSKYLDDSFDYVVKNPGIHRMVCKNVVFLPTQVLSHHQ